MDQLYDECEHKVLSQDPAENTIVFRADSRGVLEACVYTPKNCADDCTIGEWASDFACGPLPVPAGGS